MEQVREEAKGYHKSMADLHMYRKGYGAPTRNSPRSKYYRWLISQTDRDDIVGDLAGDARRDESFPKGAATFAEVKSYLSPHWSVVGDAVKESFKEFRAQENKGLEA